MVTILLATLNGEDYLKAQLESIAAQTYENWQLVVGDDGSTDGTISILEEFSKHEGYYCFHAGTKFEDGNIVTNGGRVLGVTALGDTLKEARANAYKAVDWVDFDNKYYRHDIGKAIDEA